MYCPGAQHHPLITKDIFFTFGSHRPIPSPSFTAISYYCLLSIRFTFLCELVIHNFRVYCCTMRICILLFGSPLIGAFTPSLSKIFHRPGTEIHQPISVFMSEPQDGEALQSLFAKQCDPDGLMTKTALAQVPSIADLMVRLLT